MDVKNISEILEAPQWSETYENLTTGPFEYLSSNPGKSLRSTLIRAFQSILEVDESTINGIENVVNILHISSLMIDDIEDNAILRRGKPAVHTIFGVPQTINTSNYMYFQAMNILNKTYIDRNIEQKAQRIFVEEMINLHRGQGLDLYWRDNLQCPHESEYVNMVMNKTGGLFRLALRLLLLDPGYELTEEFERYLIQFSNLLGIIYQIKDDYLNLNSEVMETNKGFCEDITEGKFSFPIMHSVLSNPSNKQLINILKLHTNDVEMKKHALEYIKSTGSFEYTRKSIKNLAQKGSAIIDILVNILTESRGEEFAQEIKEQCSYVLTFISAI